MPASAAASTASRTVVKISNSAFGGIDPVSRTIQVVISAALASTSDANLRITSPRDGPGVAAQATCARCALLAAAATSAAFARPDSNSTSPVALSVTAIVPPRAFCHAGLKISPAWSGPIKGMVVEVFMGSQGQS